MGKSSIPRSISLINEESITPILQKEFPLDSAIYTATKGLLQSQLAQLSDIISYIIQDPILILEIFNVTNSNNETLSLVSAVSKYNYYKLLNLLNDLALRPQYEDPLIRQCFDELRHSGRRLAITTRVFAEILAKENRELCQIAAILAPIGDMLALVNLGKDFVQILDDSKKNGESTYYLCQKRLNFDLKQARYNYLKLKGTPKEILNIFSLSPDETEDEDSQLLTNIVFSAIELVKAFDSRCWKEMKDRERLSNTYAIKKLPITDDIYIKLYERIANYLNISKIDSHTTTNTQLPDFQPNENNHNFKSQNIIPDESTTTDLTQKTYKVHPSSESSQSYEFSYEIPSQNRSQTTSTHIHSINHVELTNEDAFFNELSQANQNNKNSNRFTKKTLCVKENSSCQFIEELDEMLKPIKDCERLLSSFLDKMTDSGMFKKAAMLVMSLDYHKAMITACSGENIHSGQIITIDDQMSPIANRLSKIRSFAAHHAKEMPLSSKTFAIMPLHTNQINAASLYVDCGEDTVIPLEKRRLFRLSATMLNNYLRKSNSDIVVEMKKI